MKKGASIFVIGSGGFLGAHLVAAARRAGYAVVEGERSAINITDRDSVDRAFETARPETVVLLAGIADIDRSEAAPELASKTNVDGPRFVAEACARTGARLLFSSTGAVFDGKKHGYTETDPPTPVSVYGRTKAEAERVVAAIVPSAIIVRIPLAIGFSLRPGTNSMLDSFAARLAKGETVALPVFEFRNPIDPGTLSDFALELLERAPEGGLYHVGCSDDVSRYELGLRLARRLGYPESLIQPQHVPTPGRAPRGADHYLLTEKIAGICTTPVPTCDQVIERCFHGSAQGSL